MCRLRLGITLPLIHFPCLPSLFWVRASQISLFRDSTTFCNGKWWKSNGKFKRGHLGYLDGGKGSVRGNTSWTTWIGWKIVSENLASAIFHWTNQEWRNKVTLSGFSNQCRATKASRIDTLWACSFCFGRRQSTHGDLCKRPKITWSKTEAWPHLEVDKISGVDLI